MDKDEKYIRDELGRLCKEIDRGKRMKKIGPDIWIVIVPCLAILLLLGMFILMDYHQATGITSWVVYDKDYVPAHKGLTMAGKVLMTQDKPAHWTIYIKNGKEANWFDVSEEEYNKANVGEIWTKR